MSNPEAFAALAAAAAADSAPAAAAAEAPKEEEKEEEKEESDDDMVSFMLLLSVIALTLFSRASVSSIKLIHFLIRCFRIHPTIIYEVHKNPLSE